jgi:choline-sulfatase
VIQDFVKNPDPPGLIDPQVARTRNAMYYACLMQMDDRLGAILQAIRDLGLERDTIVIYCADHGCMAGDKGLWLKFVMYERSASVPLMFRVPGIDTGGQRCGSLASLVQVLPTLAELCGVPLDSQLDGESLVPLIRDPGRILDSTVYAEFNVGTPRANHMVRRGDFKYVRHRADIGQLYDLRRDPWEMRNLALSPGHEDLITEFQAQIEKIYPPSGTYRSTTSNA